MNLYLLRHGLAVERTIPGFKLDRDRPLTATGRKKTRRLAALMQQLQLSFDLILSSPYVRARQTAEEYWRACNALAELSATRDLQPDDPPAWIRDRLRGETRDILIAGHFPHLPGLLTLLTGPAEAGHHQAAGAHDERAFPQHGVVALSSDDEGTTWKEMWRIGS